jgi:hypothetical protein
MLKRDLFSGRIDWGKLDALLEKGYFAKNFRESRLTLRRIEGCVIMQRILEEAEKIRT